tara:strand:+ start:910 stop:2742 length:1833 start_codon:yes stop_codon:yes gene_type:complete
MGTGIFFLPAVGAKFAGPASILSWVLLSIVAIYIGMCFAELSSMFPKAGGVYEFCKQAYGRFWSFIIGWITLIAGYITIAMLIVGAIHYLVPVDIPWIKISTSLLYIFVFNYIAFRGMKTSAFMLVTFAFITLGTLFALIIPGLFRLNIANFSPFFVFPASATFVAIFFIAETFFGWETATFLAGETKDSKKVMPKALIYSTVIIAVICILFVVTSLGAINWSIFGESSTPLSDLGKLHYGNIGVPVFTILVYLAIIGSVAGWIVSAPRLILAMAEDKLFLSQFSKVHPKYFTPYKAILFQTIVTVILVFIASGSYNTLLRLLVPLVLIMYSAVLLSLVILRFKKPDIERYYKAPFGKIGPFFIILINIFLLVMWLKESEGSLNTLLLGLSFVLIGFPLYFLLEMYYNPKTIVKVNNFLAYIAYLTEKITLPVKVRKELLRLLGNVKCKSILEYGCNVGTLTMHLADAVSPKGKIYATDESKHALQILQKRIIKKGHKHVKIHLDRPNRIHPNVPKVDAAISVGMIGSLQKEEKVLKELNQRLRIGSRIVFLDFDKFFDVIPNVEWLSKDKNIRKVFSKCGFKVSVIRKQGFAWQYIYIHGKKVKNIKLK